MAEVNISGISKAYTPNQPILSDFNLDIHSGEMFFLLGPSGCGKSTLLRILAGLVTPDSGSIRFDGREIGTLPPEKRRAAMVFQNYALWPHLTVFENVAFGLRCAGVGGRELKKRVTDALEMVRLADFAERKSPSLSGGQQQRVALARALAVDPLLLLLDEPLSNLDARLRDTMRGEIRRICRERRLTALYVTHDRREAFSMADRAAVMFGGKIRQLDVPERLYNFPADRFCAEFLGDVNFIPGRMTGGVFSSRLGEFVPEHPLPDGPATAMLRPERLRFAGAGDTGDGIGFDAVVTDRMFLGESCEWSCRAGDLELLVRESSAPARPVGAAVRLTFDPAYAVLTAAEAR